MLQKRKIAIALFNRASYSRVRGVIECAEKMDNIELVLILGSTLLSREYGSAAEYIIREHTSSYHLIPYKEHEGAKHIKISADILNDLSEYLPGKNFDCMVVFGDRFETLPAAQAASYLNIPVVHIQGGEITRNIDERLRHAVTKLSDYHFVSTTLSKEYLYRMGEEKLRIYVTGCPSIDMLKKWRIARNCAKEDYIICIFHPHTEEVESAKEQTEILLNCVVEFCAQNNFKCFWFWPNVDPGRDSVASVLDDYHKKYPMFLEKMINIDSKDFFKLLRAARFIIGNSSVGLRESSLIGAPSINVGLRQGLRERSWNVIDTDFDEKEILMAMEAQKRIDKYPVSNLYGKDRPSKTIVSLLSTLELTLKPPLQYPFLLEYSQKHLSEERFHAHKKQNRVESAPYFGKHLQGESGEDTQAS